METWQIMLINGLISGAFSFLSYYQAIKKNKSDFFNNQLSIIEAEIDYIKEPLANSTKQPSQYLLSSIF